MSDTALPTINLADVARATLRHLAANRLAPTPENYARAWELVGGSAWSTSGPPTQPMTSIERRADESRPAGASPGPSGTACLATEAAEAVRIANRRVRLIQAMTELLETVCDVVPELAWGEEWVGGQFAAIRQALLPAQGQPDRGLIVQLRDDLRLMVDQHAGARAMRRDSLKELKTVLPQWLAHVTSLSDSSRDYGDRLTTFADRIRTVDSLEALTSTLSGIIADTEAVRGRMEATQGDLADSVERAEALEARVIELSRQLSASHSELQTDHLTGLLNRRGFDAAFTAAWAQCVQDGRPVSVAMIDLDDFKQVNDTRGHAAGDELLRSFAANIVREFRPGDCAARYGGDEFVVLLPGVGAESATEVVRRLLRSQTQAALLGAPAAGGQSFSAGIAAVVDGDLQAALERADDALYDAKRAGKRRIATRA